MTIKELRQQTGLSQSAFAKYFEIPLRTVQDWEQGKRKPPEYLVKLMQYKLEKESYTITIKGDTATIKSVKADSGKPIKVIGIK